MALRTWVGGTSGAWSTAANWLEGSVPVNSDDVLFTNSAVDVDTGLNQSAVTLTSLTVDQTYTGKWATASTYLQVGVSGTVTLGAKSPTGQGNGSGRLNLDLGSTTPSLFIQGSASTAADTGMAPIRIKSSGTIVTSAISGGSSAIADVSGNACTITTLSVTGTSTFVYLGVGATVTNLNQNGGVVDLRSANTVTSAKIGGGTYNVNGNAAHTTLLLRGGSCNYNGTGTITNTKINSGTLDFRGDLRAKTSTNTDLWATATLYSHFNVAHTNGVRVNHCDVTAVNLSLGTDVSLALTYL